MDARSRGRETDLRRRVVWEPSADQSEGGAACNGAGASFEPSGDAGGTKVAGAAGEAIDKACPGQPAYILGGIQINGPTEGPELLAIRHFELRAPDGTLTDKMAALERALDLQVNGFN